jgi:Domain of unknown function (DUF4292)
MNNVIRRFALFSALACSISLSAQTADEIVQKYLAAIGGKEAISQVKSLSMETSVQIMGNEAPSTTVIVDGVGYRTDTEFNGSKMVQCYTDKAGWMVNPMTGSSDPTVMPDDLYNLGKGQIYVGGALYDYAARGGKVELLSKDATTYKVKLTSKDNVEALYVIDAATYLVKSITSKGKMQDQEVNITSSFSDYRKTDVGYLVPYSIDVDFGGQFSLSIAVKKVELNKTIDPVIFAMPKSAPPATAPPADTEKPKE